MTAPGHDAPGTQRGPEIDRDPEETREEPEIEAPRRREPEIEEPAGPEEPEMPGRDPRERKPEVDEPPPPPRGPRGA